MRLKVIQGHQFWYQSKLESAVFAEAAPVCDELGCPNGVFLVEVRPHHSAPPTVALAQGCGAN